MDCVVILTDHKEFYNLDWGGVSKEMRNKVVVDMRNIVNLNEIKELEFIYCKI